MINKQMITDYTGLLVYKTGGDYTDEYVERLAASMLFYGADNVIVLSDKFNWGVNGRVHFQPLKYNLPGWWSKIELFNNKFIGSQVATQFLYCDLDTVINGDITPLFKAAQAYDFVMARGPLSGRGNSSVMSWSLTPTIPIPTIKDQAKYTTKDAWGDQDWINHHLKIPARYWDEIGSLMVVDRKTYPVEARREARIVMYRGEPRPHKEGWAI